MKKMYIAPAMEAAFIQATQMLAFSVGKYDDPTIPGKKGLVKEQNNWDVFGDDEAE